MKVLAVSSSERSREILGGLIADEGASVSLAASSAAARRRILDEEWDAVIISYPLSDEPGMELAHMAAEESDAAVIMLMRAEAAAAYSERLSGDGILTVVKPVLRASLSSALSLASCLRAMKAENLRKIRSLESRIEDLKIIGKAKCALALKKGMDEEESHRMIERLAMDRRITLRSAAMLVLREMKEGDS